MKTTKTNSMMYKGMTLVRCNNQCYYGSMEDEFIAFIQILQTKNIDGEEIGDKVFVQLLSTDTSKPPAERIVKQGDRSNLLNALEIANVWLSRANSEK